MKLPSYLHIGYSKSASTWLQEVMRNSDKIHMAYQTYFFNPLDSENYSKGVEFYTQFFESASNDQVIIESQEHIIMPEIHPVLKCASTNMESVSKVALRIKNTLPDVKIILIIRNQTQMIISRYLQYVVQGGWLEPALFFGELIMDNKFKKYADYRYYEVISILNEIFGEVNVCVLLQEEIITEPQFVQNKLKWFMGVDLDFESVSRKKNIGNSFAAIQLIRRLNAITVRDIETFGLETQTRIPYHLWLYIKEGIRKLDAVSGLKRNKSKYMTEEIKAYICSAFAEDNKKLESYLGRPVSQLGYYQ